MIQVPVAEVKAGMVTLRDMSSARKRKNLHPRKRLGEHGNYRREGGRALVAEREEGWPGEPSDPFEVEAKLLWIARLVEERRGVLDERLLELGRHLLPRAGTERHGLDELLGGTGKIPGGNALDHGPDPLIHFLEHRRSGGIIGEHVVGFDSGTDEILIEHRARSRRGFATGAVIAAEWIATRTGVHAFDAVLDDLTRGA